VNNIRKEILFSTNAKIVIGTKSHDLSTIEKD